MAVDIFYLRHLSFQSGPITSLSMMCYLYLRNSHLNVKWNEWGFRPPWCTYRLNWAEEPPEDGEMNEMTLPSRHRIRNSSPGGLRPSEHRRSPQYWIFTSKRRRNFFFWNLNARAWFEPAITDIPSRQPLHQGPRPLNVKKTINSCLLKCLTDLNTYVVAFTAVFNKRKW